MATAIPGTRLPDESRVEDVENGQEFNYAFIDGTWWIKIPNVGAIGLNQDEHPVTVEADASITCSVPIRTETWIGTVTAGQFMQTNAPEIPADINA